MHSLKKSRTVKKRFNNRKKMIFCTSIISGDYLIDKVWFKLI